MAKKRRRRRATRTTAAEATPEAANRSRAHSPSDGEAAAGVPSDESPGGLERCLTVRFERLAVVGLLALGAVNMVAAAVRNSAVADELGAHIPAGYLYWLSGQYSGGIDNFPLGQLWIALPVKLLGLDYPLFTEQHLLLFRLPVIGLGLVVMWAVHGLSRQLYGRVAGVAAVFLAALSPNLLAHSTLATLDLVTTCAVLVAIVCLYRYAGSPTVARMAWASAALAAALAVKIQAVLLLPIVVLALALAVTRQRRDDGRSPWSMAASWLLLPVTAVIVINLVYLQVPFVDGGLLPEPYIDAFQVKLSHGAGGHFAYLLGRYSGEGWWYYFPLAIVFKTPLPTLLLVGLGLARRQRVDTLIFVLLPIVLFLGAGMVGQLNIGLRHVLPIYPFLLITAGAGATRLTAGGWRRHLLGVLAAAYVVQALWIAPHHLSYFNVLAGGPRNGHRILLDSNYDWGQNDRFLERHVARTGRPYQIDPDPFIPASGPVLVNANALYGLLNGGPAAYQWLRDVEPVDRIAYTWFEYRLPDDSESEKRNQWQRLDRLGGHLQSLRSDRALDDPTLRLTLAEAFATVTLYGPAFEEIRTVLRQDPANEAALRLGGELIVRHKLGVLKYRGDEYLTGFRKPPPAFRLEPPEVVDLALGTGVGDELSTLYTVLGSSRFSERRLSEAIVATRMAWAMDPANDVARDNLRQMEAIARRQ